MHIAYDVRWHESYLLTCLMKTFYQYKILLSDQIQNLEHDQFKLSGCNARYRWIKRYLCARCSVFMVDGMQTHHEHKFKIQ